MAELATRTGVEHVRGAEGVEPKDAEPATRPDGARLMKPPERLIGLVIGQPELGVASPPDDGSLLDSPPVVRRRSRPPPMCASEARCLRGLSLPSDSMSAPDARLQRRLELRVGLAGL
jgi:hypothetical protein